jgi:hypothetical protein
MVFGIQSHRFFRPLYCKKELAMAITSLSTQEFAQDLYKAFRATETGPVFITEDDTPTHVLISYADYLSLLAQTSGIASSLAMPDLSGDEFEAPRVNIGLKPADFS